MAQVVEWMEPALLWPAGAKANNIRAPRIVEIRTDEFMEEFLQAMRGERPHAYVQDRLAPAAGGAVKLFQPLHGCYYLVLGSLVCRQVGLPDRAVRRNAGQATGFVVRRITGGVEQGWVNEGEHRGWNPVDVRKGLVTDEEVLPLHPVQVCTEQTPGLAAYRVQGNCARTIYHGYVPVGNYDKYTAEKKYAPAAPKATPDAAAAQNAALFSAYLAEVYADDTGGLEDAGGGFRASEFDTRVIGPWQQADAARALDQAKLAGKDKERQRQAEYYIIVDLADFVARALPDVWKAIKKFYGGESNPKAGVTGAQLVLLNHLLNDPDDPIDNTWNAANDGALGKVMYDVRAAVDGASEYLLPVVANVPTNLKLGTLPGTLKTEVIAALGQTPATKMQVSGEFAELLREQVRATKPAGGARYFLRMVYTHDPLCPPLLSDPSADVQFARFFDGDAPARKVRIEAPRMADLRKFKPGVGIAMDKDLRDVLNRVHEGLKDGDPLTEPSVNWELGMICTFSIQIVFMVAFIVMFIFLILLNIVFWWLPFLKICLPIPKPK
jgi:hypothetical protein